MPSSGSRRWLRWGIAATVLLLITGGVVAFVLLHTPENVSHPSLSFTTTSSTAAAAPKRREPAFEWPRYGFDAGRTRTFAARRLKPPLRVGWRFQDYALLEFPPVIY